jgi:uncharacterized protein
LHPAQKSQPSALRMSPASRFVVKRSRIHGTGLFAGSPLPPRRKLGELSGVLITAGPRTERLARRRCVKLVEFGDGWALDASRRSNEFQFVNHSCAPNTYIRCCRHRVEFYSLRAIEPGEELTCNYGETQHEGTLPCRCGSDGCRGRL